MFDIELLDINEQRGVLTLHNYRQTLEAWKDEKLAKFDHDSATAAKLSKKHGGREGYAAHLKESIEAKHNHAEQDAAMLAENTVCPSRRKHVVSMKPAQLTLPLPQMVFSLPDTIGQALRAELQQCRARLEQMEDLHALALEFARSLPGGKSKAAISRIQRFGGPN